MQHGNRVLFGILSALVAATSMAPPGLAQTPTGTIQGVVEDVSGALVPTAKVLIVNIDTNESRSLNTDSAGRFVQPFLLPGRYNITVEKSGFRTARQEYVKLDVGQVRAVTFRMELGDIAQHVTVEAAATALDTSTSAVGQVIENKRILDLPLNGRSAFALANLTPGVNPTGGGATPNMGGSRNSISELQIDGVTDLVSENNPGISARIYEPQVDAVAEFNVQVNSLAAEYGRFGGGLINVVTKSGTNQIHGTAYEFLRNSKLDANNFFSNRAGRGKGSFKRNQWGGTIGGPIVIPWLYNGRDKSFFFSGFEATNNRPLSVFTGTVPIAAWRQGDFSGLRTSSGQNIVIHDPLTTKPDPSSPGRYVRDPFPANTVPGNRIDPVAAATKQFWPTPNATPINPYTNANNFTVAGTDASNSYRMDNRIDHNFTSRWRMFARVSLDWGDSSAFSPYGNPGSPSGALGNNADRSVSLDHTITGSPTLIGNVRYGFGRTAMKMTPPSDGINLTTLGFPAYVDQVAAIDGREFPRLDFSGAAASLGQPNWRRQRAGWMVHSLAGNVTKIRSGHTLKAGAEYRKFLVNYAHFGRPSGQYTFNSGWTQREISTASSTAGFPLASYLLGLPASGSMSHDPAAATASEYFALYLQDDWKATSRLTVNIGLRYDFDTPRTERYDRLSVFELGAPSPLAGKVPSSACPECGNLRGAYRFMDRNNRRQTPTDRNNFGPRIGLAYNVTPKTVIRSGYGISYAPSAVQAAGVSGGAGMNGYRTSTSYVGTLDSMRTIKTTISNPYPDGFNLPPGRSLGALTDVGLGVSGESVFDGYRNPYVQQWNLNIQREVPGGMVVEVGYLGNRSIGLVDGDGTRQYNQLRPSLMQLGPELLRLVPNPFFGIITDARSTLRQPTIEYRQLLRPFPQYTSVTSFRKPIASSNYHGMTVRVDKRFSKGYSVLLAYTAGKLLDDSSQAVGFLGPVANTKLDFYNRSLDKAVSSLDVAQRFVASYVWELPFGTGQRFLTGLPGGFRHLVSGWQVNGILTFQSGTPVIVGVSQNNTQIFTASQRPNNNGKSARLTGGDVQTRLRRWFDTSVFSLPAPYTFGNAPRTLPDVRNPGKRHSDLSILKNSYFGPDSRLNLQYRIEMFNAFNTPQFGAPGGTVGTGGFGLISSTAGSPRQIQMALKLIW